MIANSPWAEDYFHTLHVYVGPLSVLHWINDALMAVFFLVVGLEIKYEILRGELSDPKKLAMPVIAALGGMIGPAAVYLAMTVLIGAPHQGWPIPLATDIAFALAVFAFVGKGLPSSLRIFLLTLAIVDDLGAIALIAVLAMLGPTIAFGATLPLASRVVTSAIGEAGRSVGSVFSTNTVGNVIGAAAGGLRVAVPDIDR